MPTKKTTSLPPSLGPIFQTNGPNGLIFPADDKSELLVDSLQRQFMPNPSCDLLEVNNYQKYYQNLKDTQSPKKHFFHFS